MMRSERLISIEDENTKVVCVDCFDTILYRTCSASDSLLLFFRLISSVLPLSENVLREVWSLSRETTNRRSLSEGKEEASFADLSFEMWSRICALSSQITLSYNEFCQLVKREMTVAENSVIVVNDKLVNWLKSEKEKGRKIICISDFYMSGEWISNLFKLRNIRQLFDEIYVSSDIGLRKSSGQLYSYVRYQIYSNRTVAYDEIMMIGDNKESDFSIPRKLGIKSYLYKEAFAEYKVENMKKQLEKIYHENFKANNPFANYVFSLFLFCERLADKLTTDNDNDVWFFSREGKLLKKLFEEYMSLNNIHSINTHYLYISRQSTFITSLKPIENEDFYYLRTKSKDLSIDNFLQSLGISSQGADAMFENNDTTKIIIDFFRSKEFELLKKNEQFTDLYERTRANAKIEAKAYFQSQGLCVDHDAKYVIVDIGWKGSIQDCLYKTFDKEYNIYGYYYGLEGDVFTEFKNQKKGLLFSDYPVKNGDYNIYRNNYRMLERILCADHGGCLQYKNSMPVLKDYKTNESELFDYVQPIQAAILGQFVLINRILDSEKNYANDKVLDTLAIRELHKLFCVDVNKERYIQMEYMNQRMDMNFAGFGQNEVFDISAILKRLIKEKNWLGLVQKTEFLLYRKNLGMISAIIRKIACRIV